MKNFLPIFLLLIFNIQQGQTQINSTKSSVLVEDISHLDYDKHRCGTPPPDEATHQYILDEIIAKENTIALLENDVTNCLPIKVHIVREDDGSGGLPLGDLAIAFANLNYVFYNADIEFFVCGDINYIDNSDFYNFDATAPDNDDETTFTSPHEVTNAINVFFMNDIITSSGFNAAGYAYFPFNAVQSNRIFMINSVADNAPNSTFSHELGHYFALYHTHEGTENGSTDPDAENVPRTGSNANCTTDGDLLCDTDADPRYNSSEFNFSSCTYTGSGTDINGVPFSPSTAIDNIMSYYPDACGGTFTSGQYTRMGSALTTRMGFTAYNYSCTATSVTPASGMIATVNGNQIDLSWTDNASNELGYIIEVSTTSSTSGFLPVVYGGVSPNVTIFSDTENIMSNTTYYYRVRPVNSACDNYSNVASVTTGMIYCTPTYLVPCTNSILNDFSMNGDNGANEINNTSSSCSTNSYGNFTNLSADVTAGVSYSFTVCKSLTFTRYVDLWADWNQDGDFNDAGEQIINAATLVPNACYNGSITIPASAISGNTTLRVVLASGSGPTDPCDTYDYGETEDYTLNVDGIGGLPIELTQFKGRDRNETVLLEWQTATEVNNDYFTLEKSKDGFQFEEIAEIKGAGNSVVTQYYTHIDLTPIHGNNYYRLKQTDFNGSYSYSDIIVVTIQIQEMQTIELIPNPVHQDELTVLYTAVKTGNLVIQLLDVNGKLIQQNMMEVMDGKNNLTLDVSSLNSGVYFIRTNFKNEIQTNRFVRL